MELSSLNYIVHTIIKTKEYVHHDNILFENQKFQYKLYLNITFCQFNHYILVLIIN